MDAAAKEIGISKSNYLAMKLELGSLQSVCSRCLPQRRRGRAASMLPPPPPKARVRLKAAVAALELGAARALCCAVDGDTAIRAGLSSHAHTHHHITAPLVAIAAIAVHPPPYATKRYTTRRR